MKLILTAAAVLVSLVFIGSATAAPFYNSGGSVQGEYVAGKTLTASPGTWAYVGTISYAYAWKRGSTQVGTGTSYTTGAADVGQTLTLAVTATDQNGSTSVDIPAFGAIQWPSPVNVSLPTITGELKPGGTLTVHTGDWQLQYVEQPGPITYRYAWYLSYPGGGDGYWTDVQSPVLPANSPPGLKIMVTVNATAPNGLGFPTCCAWANTEPVVIPEATTPQPPPPAPSAPAPPAPAPPPPLVVIPPIEKVAVTPELKLLGARLLKTPAKQGKRLSIALYVVRSDTGKRITSGLVSCKISGLRAARQGWSQGNAACGWDLPRKLKPGTRTGLIEVSALGVTLRRAFTVRIGVKSR